MEAITIQATPREAGKKAVKEVRRNGGVPCVLYGHGIEPLAFSVDASDLKSLIYSDVKNKVVLTLDGKTYACIAKEIDFHPVTDHPIHIDFQALVEGEVVRTTIPVHITGTARGVVNGGALKRVIHKVDVECAPEALPSFINADVTPLRIGGVLRVGNLKVEGVKMLSPASQAIAMVVTKRAAIITEDEDDLEEGAEEVATEEASE